MVNSASCTSLSCSGEGKLVSLPGIEEGAIQKRAIVMIPEEVPTLTSALTVLGDYLVLDGNTVLGVMEVQQCNIKDEGRLPRDVFPWREMEERLIPDTECGRCFSHYSCPLCGYSSFLKASQPRKTWVAV